MRRLFQAYEKILLRYPFTSQALQTGILVGTGDIISQVVVERHPISKIHKMRTIQFFCVGAFYVGPAVATWYKILHRVVGETGGKSVALKKMLVDQICFAPLCLAGFLGLVDTLQEKSFKEIKDDFKEKYPEILLANYKLWPAVQLINFYFLPLHFQVMYVQIVALFWNTYICFKTRPKEDE